MIWRDFLQPIHTQQNLLFALDMSAAKIIEFSKAVMLLQKKIRNEEILSTKSAKMISESDPIFMKRKLENFRGKLNRLKAKKEQFESTLSCAHIFCLQSR